MGFEDLLRRNFTLFPLQQLAFDQQESEPNARVIAIETPELPNGKFVFMIL